MSSNAEALVEGAKKWATHYGPYPNGVEGAVVTAQLRVRAGWDANDADAIADLFVDNGSMLVGDAQLSSREEIRAYLADAFAGGFQGTRLTDEPKEVRLLTDSVAIAVTEGGVVKKGQDDIDPEELARSLWVLVKKDGDWRVVSRQTSPVNN